jgi:4-amino-4-deoxy-L-arabinose transferase-like glycosyltransferase
MLSELNMSTSPDGSRGTDVRTEPAADGHTVAVLAAILLLGAVLRVWGLRFGLPHDFSRPDEEKIVGAALGVLQGDLNPHMFLYPSLFIYANAAVYWMLFAFERTIGATASRADFVAGAAADPTLFYITARLLAAASGTATIAALYAGARELFSGRIALVAAAALAVVFLHVRDSHFGVTDVPVTLLVVLAWWSAARCFNRGLTRRRVIVTGILCGLAASTKYNAALVVLPAIGAVVSQYFKAGSLSLPKPATALFILLTCAGLAFLLGTPYALLDRPAFLAEVDAQRQTAAGLRHGTVLDPAREVIGERGWIHHATFSLRYGMGMPLLVAGLMGATWVIWQGPLVAWLVLSFPLAFYVAMGGSQLVYPRWVVPLVPFLCLTAAVAIDRLAVLLGALLARLIRASASMTVIKIVVAGLTVLIVAPSGARAVAFDQLVSRADTRVRAAEWIEGRFPHGASLYQTGMQYSFVEPRPRLRYPLYTFNERHNVFDHVTGSDQELPDLILVLSSPLVVFNQIPSGLDAILRSQYGLIATFKARSDADAGPVPVYDQQDAFYVPFANFGSVSRPGPDVQIYERRDTHER